MPAWLPRTPWPLPFWLEGIRPGVIMVARAAAVAAARSGFLIEVSPSPFAGRDQLSNISQPTAAALDWSHRRRAPSRRRNARLDRHNDAGSAAVSIEGSGSPTILASNPRNR